MIRSVPPVARMDLVALTAFQQIAEHGGVGRASRAAAVPKTTLSRRLRQLEEALGVPLVERGPRLFRLTDEGVALFERTRALLTELDEAGRSLAGGFAHPRGRLRVSAPTLFTDFHMGSIAATFTRRYPEMILEIVSENRVIDPLQEGFDAVVRVNPDANDELVGRLLYRDDMLLVASGPCPPTSTVGEILVPAVVLSSVATERPWTVQEKDRHRDFRPQPVLWTTSILAARQAVLAGTGAALLPRSVVASDLVEGRLTCWGRSADRPAEIWVLHRSRRLRSPKLSAFVDFLCAAFAEQRELDRPGRAGS